MLNNEQIKHIAQLSRLELNEKEIKRFSQELSQILAFVDKLGEADTKNVSTADGGTISLENSFKPDEKNNKDWQKTQNLSENLLNLSPSQEKREVKVKNVFK